MIDTEGMTAIRADSHRAYDYVHHAVGDDKCVHVYRWATRRPFGAIHYILIPTVDVDKVTNIRGVNVLKRMPSDLHRPIKMGD